MTMSQPEQSTPPNPSIWSTEAQQITFENMQKLSKQDEFTIGDKKYRRRMLKPKDMVQLGKLQKKMDEATKDDNDELMMDTLREQAKIVLDNFTDAEFDEIDVVGLQATIGACLLISKGFRRI